MALYLCDYCCISSSCSIFEGGSVLSSSFTIVLAATLRDVPQVTDLGILLSLRESPRHLATKRLVLVDEDKEEKVEEEVVRALKKRRR